MKKVMPVVLFAILIMSMISADATGQPLITTAEFLINFNLYASMLGLGHELSTDSAEISTFSDSVLLKQVINGCEIVSLNLSPDSKSVTSIRCTWSTLAPGSYKYSDDFIYLLMEVLMACGLESDGISDVFLNIGISDNFNVGDSGERVADGIRVSYEVTSTYGVSFTIIRV